MTQNHSELENILHHLKNELQLINNDLENKNKVIQDLQKEIHLKVESPLSKTITTTMPHIEYVLMQLLRMQEVLKAYKVIQ